MSLMPGREQLPVLRWGFAIGVSALVVFGAVVAGPVTSAYAGSRAATEPTITGYDATVRVNADGTLHVTEAVTYNFAGSSTASVERTIVTREQYDSTDDRVYDVSDVTASAAGRRRHARRERPGLLGHADGLLRGAPVSQDHGGLRLRRRRHGRPDRGRARGAVAGGAGIRPADLAGLCAMERTGPDLALLPGRVPRLEPSVHDLTAPRGLRADDDPGRPRGRERAGRHPRARRGSERRAEHRPPSTLEPGASVHRVGASADGGADRRPARPDRGRAAVVDPRARPGARRQGQGARHSSTAATDRWCSRRRAPYDRDRWARWWTSTPTSSTWRRP